MVEMIDPPSGWKYGFPKIYDNPDGLTPTEWCLQNGYPEHELDKDGNCYWIRFISYEEEEVNEERD